MPPNATAGGACTAVAAATVPAWPDLLRTVRDKLKQLSRAVSVVPDCSLEELARQVVAAVVAFVDAAKLEVVPVSGDAIVYFRLYETTLFIDKLCASLPATGHAADEEVAKRTPTRPAHQALELAAQQLTQHVAYLSLIVRNITGTQPRLAQLGLTKQQLATRDGLVLTAIFTKTVALYLEIVRADLKHHVMYGAADVLISAGRLVAYIHSASQCPLQDEGQTIEWETFRERKMDLIQVVFSKAQRLLQNSKILLGIYPPADIKEQCTASAKEVAEHVRILLQKAKQAGIINNKLRALDIWPGFGDLLLTITFDPKTSGTAALMELAVKSMVAGISKIRENSNNSSDGMQDGLEIVQRAVGDLISEVSRLENNTVVVAPTSGRGSDDFSAATDGYEELIEAPAKSAEEAIQPVIRGIQQLNTQINSNCAISEEYLESLAIIESTCSDVLALMDPSHRTTVRLEECLDKVSQKTKLAAGSWLASNAIEDMRAALMEMVQVLKQLIQQDKEEQPEKEAIFVRRPSTVSVRTIVKPRSGSASTASISSQDDSRPITRSSSLMDMPNPDEPIDTSSGTGRRHGTQPTLRIDTQSLYTDVDAKAQLVTALQKLAMQVKLRHLELQRGDSLGSADGINEAAANLGFVAKTTYSNHLALIYRPPTPMSPTTVITPVRTTNHITESVSQPKTPVASTPQTSPVPATPVNAVKKNVFFTATSSADSSPTPNNTPAQVSSSKQLAVAGAATVSAGTAGKLLNTTTKTWSEALGRHVAQRDQTSVANDINTLLAQRTEADLRATFDDIAVLPMSGEFATGIALPEKEFQVLLADDMTELVVDEQALGNGTKKQIVRGGSTRQLVNRLTYHKYPDTDYCEAFLLTYRSFTQPMDVLNALIAQFERSPPFNLSKAQFDIYYKTKITPVRLRVFNVLKTWVDKHFEDFATDEPLEERLLSFIQERRTHHYYQATTFQSVASQLRRIYDKKKRSYLNTVTKLLMSQNIPTSSSFATLTAKISEIDPGELAKQLTLIDHALFRAIKPHECLNQAWNKEELKARSPNILAFIKRFNDLNKKITYEVLLLENKKERAAAVRHFIQTAEKCLALNNFNSVNAILAALSSSSVRRLSKTWELVPKKALNAFEELNRQMSHESNYAVYRNMLHTAHPPCVPFLGVSLTDLVFIEQGNKDYLSPDIVNFDKCRKTAESIREIQQYQQMPYLLPPIPHIQATILSLDGADKPADDLYELSIKLEPRKPGQGPPK